MNSKLTIVIPVYNQTELCRQCLRNLAMQTYQNFSVILLDDCSVENYFELVQEFPGLDITYIRNDKNLGAIKNIFHSIFYPVTSEYIMSMHEDDLLHKDYLAMTIGVLDAHPNSVFLGSNCVFFDAFEDIEKEIVRPLQKGGFKELSAQNLVRFFLHNNPFMLASIIYRTTFLKTEKQPWLEEMSTACDRPFLVELAKQGNCLALDQKLFFSRRHGLGDMRGKYLNWSHVFKLYDYYRRQLPEPIQASDARLFFSNSTNQLLLTYRTLLPNNRPNPFRYILEAKKKGLLNFSSLDSKGVFGIFSMAVGAKVSFYILKIFQKLRPHTAERVNV
jgi:glycosyltransferase involved in cell wall biosynthesis